MHRKPLGGKFYIIQWTRILLPCMSPEVSWLHVIAPSSLPTVVVLWKSFNEDEVMCLWYKAPS